jgi:hypothetical protein
MANAKGSDRLHFAVCHYWKSGFGMIFSNLNLWSDLIERTHLLKVQV